MITQLPPLVGRRGKEEMTARRSHLRSFGILKDLDRPGDVFRDIGPNWFASVMGTGIVAIAAATLPFRVPGLHVFALAVWVLAAGWEILCSAAARPRLPSRATDSSRSNGTRSDTLAGKLITLDYDLIGDRRLPGATVGAES